LSTIKVNNIQSRTGNAISFTSGDTITIPSGATFTNNGTVTGFGDNTPSFFATLSSNQSISTGTFTKLAFDTTSWDTNSAFDTSNNRFVVPSGQAGKYFFQFGVYADNIDDQEYFENYFFKNGSSINYGRFTEVAPRANHPVFYTTSVTVNMNVSDYMEITVYHNDGVSNNVFSNTTFFSGFKLIGA